MRARLGGPTPPCRRRTFTRRTDARAQSDRQPDGSLRADRTHFDCAVLAQFHNQRDHPALREMYELDRFSPLFLQFALLDGHLAQMLAQERQLVGFQRGEQPVSVARQECLSSGIASCWRVACSVVEIVPSLNCFNERTLACKRLRKKTMRRVPG